MDSRSARSADPTSRQLKVAGTCHPLCDLAKLIGEPNHLANGRDAVAPLPQDKVLNSKGNRKPVVWLGWLCANPYLHLNPNTRTWFPIAETRDLKMDSRTARGAVPT